MANQSPTNGQPKANQSWGQPKANQRPNKFNLHRSPSIKEYFSYHFAPKDKQANGITGYRAAKNEWNIYWDFNNRMLLIY